MSRAARASAPARALARVNWLGLLTMVALLGLWEASVHFGVLEYEFLLAPSAVFEGGRRVLSSGDLGADVFHTLRATLLGWAAAGVLGTGLGLLLGLSDAAWRYSMASLEAIRAVPPISLVPVALLVFGFSTWMEFVVIVYAATWPVMTNVIDGVRGVRPEQLDLARVLRLSRTETITKIELPAAMPLTVVGLRLALSFALVLAVVSEMVGNPSGLGHALVSAQNALRPEEMFAYVFTIGLLGVGLNAAFRHLTARPSLGGGRDAQAG